MLAFFSAELLLVLSFDVSASETVSHFLNMDYVRLQTDDY